MQVKQARRRGAYNAKLSAFLTVAAMGAAALYVYVNRPAEINLRPSPTLVQTTVTTDNIPIKEKAMPPLVTIRVFNTQGQLGNPVQQPKVIKTDEEWKKQLTKEQFYVTRNSGTERPFCGTLLDNKKEGVYTCVCCKLPLFASNAKFNSGTGWPSFFQPICKENVVEKSDATHGMVRVEINCARCDCHLGHVFEDGPKPTGLRFCLNSESLEFTEQKDLAKLAEGGK